MWPCVKCGEELEDSFEVCWNCGNSQDKRRHRKAFWAGAVVSAVVGYLDLLALVLATSAATLSAHQTRAAMVEVAGWSLLLAGVGGGAGKVGAKSLGMTRAACKGGFLLFSMHLLVLGLGNFPSECFPEMCAALVNVFALGSIAGTVGWIFGRRPRDAKAASERLQFSLSEMLFLTTLFAVLFASLAVLMR